MEHIIEITTSKSYWTEKGNKDFIGNYVRKLEKRAKRKGADCGIIDVEIDGYLFTYYPFMGCFENGTYQFINNLD